MGYTLVTPEFDVPSLFKKRPAWNIACPIDDNWRKSKRRLLFVVDHVPAADLRAKQLLSSNTRALYLNVVDHALDIAKEWGYKRDRAECAMGWVNYNFFKTYDIEDSQLRQAAEKASQERLAKLIKKLDPTHIHFLGPEPAERLYGVPIQRRGWVQKFDGRLVSTNISITTEQRWESSESDDEEEFFIDNNEMGVNRANLLGHACENLAKLFCDGYYPYSLKHIKPRWTVISTMTQFDKLLKQLYKARYFGYDTETRNLSVTDNAILTMQFTLPDDIEHTWILPLKHRDAPWSAAQLKQIMFKLREFFAVKHDHWRWDTPFMIGQNIGFDLRMTRQELGLPIIHYRVADVIAMCHLRDENLKVLPTRSTKGDAGKDDRNRPWALDNILARHENDHYFTAEFSKSDRVTIDSISLDKPVLEYMAMDTISVVNIFKMSRKWARNTRHQNGNYEATFLKLLLGEKSDTIHVMSQMSQNGLKADLNYVAKQFAKDTSQIEEERNRLIKELYAKPSVVKANQKLLKANAIPQHSLFSTASDVKGNWIFDIDKRDHQQMLFFEALKLEPVVWTSSGSPGVGKEFIKAYSDKNSSNTYTEEVVLFGAASESKKTRGYIKAYFAKLSEVDGQADQRIRAGFGYSMILTGRSNSYNPSFHNTPTHGKYAKIVKESFLNPPGCLTIKCDFSAHEIKMWGNSARDKNLTNNFKRIWNVHCRLRKKFKLDDADRQLLVDNDTHRVNYATNVGKQPKDVTPEERQISKNITFGSMFGESVRAMARKLKQELEWMQQKYDNFFNTYAEGKAFMDWSIKHAREHLYTYDILGARRNLPGHLAGDKGLSAAMDRRAMNSPIQGSASRINFIGNRLCDIKLYYAFKSEGLWGKPTWNKEKAIIEQSGPHSLICIMVHDSTERETEYKYARLMAQAMEHCLTTGLMKYLKKMYGVELMVRPEVDFDIGSSGGTMEKWDYTEWSWRECIKKSWRNHQKRGQKFSKDIAKAAIKTEPAVKRMMQHFPLDLTLYKGVD